MVCAVGISAVGFAQSPAPRDATGGSGLGPGFPSGRGLGGGLSMGAAPGSVMNCVRRCGVNGSLVAPLRVAG